MDLDGGQLDGGKCVHHRITNLRSITASSRVRSRLHLAQQLDRIDWRAITYEFRKCFGASREAPHIPYGVLKGLVGVDHLFE